MTFIDFNKIFQWFAFSYNNEVLLFNIGIVPARRERPNYYSLSEGILSPF